MRDLRIELGADDQAIFFHPTEMLVQHLLRDRRHSSFEFPDSDRSILKMTDYRDSPFPLNNRDRLPDRNLIGRLDSRRTSVQMSLAIRATRQRLDRLKAGLGRAPVIFPTGIPPDP